MSLRDAVLGMERAATEARFYLAASRLRLSLLETHYSPDQPRVPTGNPDGGQWTNGSEGPRERIDVALAGRLIDQRVGSAGGRWIRMCTYIDFLGRMYSRKIDATELCPVYYVAPPHFGLSW
jgi:hypothetical protein